MNFFAKKQIRELISSENDFSKWNCLNDTIMGGSSIADCKVTSEGLLLQGNVVEEGGGFISCRSQLFKPPLNLKSYKGLELKIDGEGRQLKFAISSKERLFGLNLIPNGVKWVYTFKTDFSGSTIINIPFEKLQPNIRAKRIILPISFNKEIVLRFQLLYSRFGKSGESNPDFTPGRTNILIRSISAFS